MNSVSRLGSFLIYSDVPAFLKVPIPVSPFLLGLLLFTHFEFGSHSLNSGLLSLDSSSRVHSAASYSPVPLISTLVFCPQYLFLLSAAFRIACMINFYPIPSNSLASVQFVPLVLDTGPPPQASSYFG